MNTHVENITRAINSAASAKSQLKSTVAVLRTSKNPIVVASVEKYEDAIESIGQAETALVKALIKAQEL